MADFLKENEEKKTHLSLLLIETVFGCGIHRQVVALLFSFTLCQMGIVSVSTDPCVSAPTVFGNTWSTTSTTCTTESFDCIDWDNDIVTPTIPFLEPDPGTAPFTASGNSVIGTIDITCDQAKVQAAGIITYTLTLLLDDGCASRDPPITHTITIEFTDITANANNNDPLITPTSTDVARYLYDRDGETDVLTFTVSDADTGADGEIASVTITAKTDSAPFAIDFTASVATLKLKGSLASMPSSITLTIEATDNGASPRKGTITFTVNIKDPPAITSPTDGQIRYFCEDFEAGDAVANLNSTNPNAGTISYTVTNQSPGTYFTADDATSEIQINSGVASGTFDVDAAPTVVQQYQLTLSVSDGTYNSSISFTLEVDDVNDKTPQITSFTSTKNILDSLDAGSTIMEVAATDADRDAPNNQVTFSLSGTNNEHFVIDGNILKLATPSPLNYDIIPVYNLKIIATDQADDPDKLSSMVDITIDLDAAPELDPTYTAHIPEDSQSGAQVIELAATDKDAVAMGTSLTYSITGGNDDGYFVVDGAFIKVAAGIPETALDVDAGDKTFTLNVLVSDGKYTDTTVLTIIIDEANDNSPIFEHGSYSFDVFEKSAAGTVVANVVATDADRNPPDHTVTYTLSGTNSGDFEITGDGELKIAAGKVLNYTEVAAYSLTITASDGGTPAKSTSVIATGTVVTAPEFSSDTYEIDIGEDKEADTSVFTMTAIDRDGQTVTYKLDDASGHFKVEGALVKTSDSVDSTTFDVDVATKTFQMDLIVDDGTYNDTAVLTITVIDVNDNSPVFEEDSYRHGVNEITSEGTVLLSVAATDADKTAPNNQVTHTITGTGHENFDIDETSGAIKLVTSLNYTAVPEYNLTVTATDGGAPVRSASVLVTIPVETTPEFARPNAVEDPTLIQEDKTPGELVYTFVAIDKDTPVEELTYSIIATSSTPVPFEIVGDKLKTKSNMAASEIDVDSVTAVRSYNLTVRVYDGKYSDTGIVTIDITDVNDESPSFTEASYTVDIAENATGVITTVVAEDKDYELPNSVVSFSITDGNNEGVFAINNVTGAISVVKEVKQVGYKIEVAATDGGSPANVAKVVVVVNVDGNTIDECATDPCANGATCRPNVNYFWCDCAAGWDGTLCKINIDDCSPDPCENGGICQDQVAGYTCDCEPGWGGINCTTACVGHTYGRNCAQPCSCNNSNIADTAQARAQRCEIKAGACICNTHWQGRTCDENADECLQDSTLCPAANNACEDTIGSYECVCKTGYTTDANLDCVIDTSDNNPKNLPSNAADNAKANGRVPVMVAVVLVVSQCPNLDVPSVHASIKESLVGQLANVISKPFKVYNISCGSLTYNIFVENDGTSEAAANLSNELKTLKDNGTMTVLDQPVSISSMSVNENEVPTENRLCVIYESLTPCGDDYTCQVRDGKPYCREVKDSNTGLIMGVGIGVGVTGIMLIGIAIVVMALVRRHRGSSRSKNGSRYSSNSRSHKRNYRHNDYDTSRQYDQYGPTRKYDDGPAYLSSSKHDSPMYDAYALPSRYSAKYY